MKLACPPSNVYVKGLSNGGDLNFPTPGTLDHPKRIITANDFNRKHDQKLQMLVNTEAALKSTKE